MKLEKKYIKLLVGLLLFFIAFDVFLVIFLLGDKSSIKSENGIKDSLLTANIVDSVGENGVNKLINGSIVINDSTKKKRVKSKILWSYKKDRDSITVTAQLNIPYSIKKIKLITDLRYVVYNKSYLDSLEYINYFLGYQIYRKEPEDIQLPYLNKDLNVLLKNRYSNIPIKVIIDKLELKEM